MNNFYLNKKLREFGFLIIIIFPLFIGFISFIHGEKFLQSWIIFLIIPVLLISLIKPIWLFYPHKYWMLFGDTLSKINIYIVLGIVFIFILLPISIFMKVFGYDPLRKNYLKVNSYKELRKDYNNDLKKIF